MLPATGCWEDFASFMVPRKPGGGGCICMAYRNSSLDMPGRIGHMRALCESEPGPGVLAYVDGEVAGWCSVAPKSTHRALVNSRTIPHVDDEDAWCVADHGPERRQAALARPPRAHLTSPDTMASAAAAVSVMMAATLRSAAYLRIRLGEFTVHSTHGSPAAAARRTTPSAASL